LLTGQPADLGVMDTTQLRGISRTAPYFHNNSAATLEEVVDHYEALFRRAARLNPAPNRPPILSSDGTVIDRGFLTPDEYFTAMTAIGVHIWRQRFPDGTPEQVTFGASTEEGIHFAPDGRSFVTSIGTSQSTLWVHDSRRDRQITSEGHVFMPSTSADGKKLYYLVRSYGLRSWNQGGLWVAHLATGQRERLLAEFQMIHYSISADGQRVVFVSVDEQGRNPVWLVSLNGQLPPRQLSTMDAGAAFFDAPREVLFAGQQESYVYRVKDDGSELQIHPPPEAGFADHPGSR